MTEKKIKSTLLFHQYFFRFVQVTLEYKQSNAWTNVSKVSSLSFAACTPHWMTCVQKQKSIPRKRNRERDTDLQPISGKNDTIIAGGAFFLLVIFSAMILTFLSGWGSSFQKRRKKGRKAFTEIRLSVCGINPRWPEKQARKYKKKKKKLLSWKSASQSVSLWEVG